MWGQKPFDKLQQGQHYSINVTKANEIIRKLGNLRVSPPLSMVSTAAGITLSVDLKDTLVQEFQLSGGVTNHDGEGFVANEFWAQGNPVVLKKTDPATGTTTDDVTLWHYDVDGSNAPVDLMVPNSIRNTAGVQQGTNATTALYAEPLPPGARVTCVFHNGYWEIINATEFAWFGLNDNSGTAILYDGNGQILKNKAGQNLTATVNLGNPVQLPSAVTSGFYFKGWGLWQQNNYIAVLGMELPALNIFGTLSGTAISVSQASGVYPFSVDPRNFIAGGTVPVQNPGFTLKNGLNAWAVYCQGAYQLQYVQCIQGDGN
jgi:hypothetical protein